MNWCHVFHQTSSCCPPHILANFTMKWLVSLMKWRNVLLHLLFCSKISFTKVTFEIFLPFIVWQYRLWSFKSGDTKLERFLPKNQHRHSKGNYWILRIGVVASCQKLGIILVIKWFKNWYYQKISITKNVLLNLYSSMKKKRWERFECFLT